MHLFIQVVIIYSALLLIGALVIVRFIWTAEVYPCENCGRDPATRELATGEQLCDNCFLLFPRDQTHAIPFSQDAGHLPSEDSRANCEPFLTPPQHTSAQDDLGEGRFHQILK